MRVSSLLLVLIDCGYCLKLTESPISGLELALKLGPNDDQTGIALLESLNFQACFESFSHLMRIRTLRFRHIFQHTCKDVPWERFLNDIVRPAERLGVDLGYLVGIECLSSLPNAGKLPSILPITKIPLTSKIDLQRLKSSQIQELSRQVTNDQAGIEVLTSAFLCPEPGNPNSRHLDFSLLDGVYLDNCPKVALKLLPKILQVPIHGVKPRIKLSNIQLESRQENSATWAGLKGLMKDPSNILLMVGRIVQVGALLVYLNSKPGGARGAVRWGAVLRVFESLAILKLALSENNCLSNGILRLAFDFVSAIIQEDHLQSIRFEQRPFMLFDLVDYIPAELVIHGNLTDEQLACFVRIKIESLMMARHFNPDPVEVKERLVEGLLRSESLFNRPARIPCRLLVPFMVAYASDHVYESVCTNTMKWVLERIPRHTNLSILTVFELEAFMPWRLQWVLGRQEMFWSMSGFGWVDYLQSNQLDTLMTASGRKDEVMPGQACSSTGDSRRRVLQLLGMVLEKHLVYCGHGHQGRPVYIQSLACHPFIHVVFWKLILISNMLRIVLPFDLHPAMIDVLQNPYFRPANQAYLQAAFQAEFGHATARIRAEACILLLEQLDRASGPLDNETAYLEWTGSRTPEKVAELRQLLAPGQEAEGLAEYIMVSGQGEDLVDNITRGWDLRCLFGIRLCHSDDSAYMDFFFNHRRV